MATLEISAEHYSFYRKNGFLKLENVVPEEYLEMMRSALTRICEQPNPSVDIIKSTDVSGNEIVTGIDQLLIKSESIFTQVLGSPMMLSIAEAICGADFFPIQEFSVIKRIGDANKIDWHQDVVSSSVGTTCMIGIYLDSADLENGALRVVPGSQHLGTDICTLKELPSVAIEMQPGDVLIHDLMVAHCSGSLSTQDQRRVVYFEFMNAASAVQDSVYSATFIEARTGLIPIAMNAFQTAFPKVEAYNWRNENKSDYPLPDDPESGLIEIHVNKRDIKPANYCFDHFKAFPTSVDSAVLGKLF